MLEVPGSVPGTSSEPYMIVVTKNNKNLNRMK